MKPRGEFIEYVLELLGPLDQVEARAMFGGHGFYLDDLFFAIVVDDTLYLKADDLTRADFQTLDLEPFTYELPNRKIVSMSYFRAPDAAMDSPDRMKPWAQMAHEAAKRAAAKKPKRKKSQRTKRR